MLTGNTRTVAALKLRAFGLDRYLDLDIGAYGTDDDIRANLVKIARQRVEAARGIRFGPATTVLIGDTPHDVTAAGADAVLDDLTQTDNLLTTLTAITGR